MLIPCRINIFALHCNTNPLISPPMKPMLLQDDLIKDFQEQKKVIREQIGLIDPLAASLRKPAAKRLFHAGFLVFMEIISWLLCLGCIATVIFQSKLYPLYLLSQMLHDTALSGRYKLYDLQMLDWAVKGILLFVALLFIVIARMLARIRQKNGVLHLAGKNMKVLVEQLLHRKAAMESLEQRHPVSMPSDSDTIILPPVKPHDDTLL